MRTYELMTIHRPELAPADAENESRVLKGFLEDAEASVIEIDFWGKRRLAYEIDKVREGYYTVITFNGEPHHVTALDRALSLSDAVLRHKIIRPDARPGHDQSGGDESDQ
ncbi:MAG: 30S ribosomal protein S6 [Acidimicrobiia bacterium]|nr:30S ribosomal protein S6 [bacterium]MXX64279.1 30S ribosomal protein S6 [Acidimicrobiia bacterium]MCY3579110.1 30S ribosomal protein S6 [bacterium]MCY3653190.1 30S ribosomal protein S6 [bacterium]MDE0642650.1 30S ribosomal protein S6 [bacterium]